MAIRNIRVDSDPLLRKTSKPVIKFDDSLHVLLDDMAETMGEAEGVGLAAIQIGILKRIFIVDVGEGVIEFINPTILKEEGEQIGDEGCLSVPKRFGQVKRPNIVTISAQDRFGTEFEITRSELFARAICHEMDHLNGKIFTDLVIGEIFKITDEEEIE
ncbi:MAG: peptide deformylase [Epulopiscium sp. Nuni2H_MBin003]|nr:MAG: peptide deformylase [Epulopiscium sp. Nuni2H_MBin003]